MQHAPAFLKLVNDARVHVKELTVAEARAHLAAGEFPPGSMGPKIEAAIEFIEKGGEECIITSTEQVAAALDGNAGTHLIAAWGRRSLAFPPPQN